MQLQANLTDIHMQKNEKKHEHYKTCRLCKYTLMAFMLTAAGCAPQTSAPPRIMVQDNDLYVEADQDISSADIMEAAEDVLAGMYFTIEKADLQNGVIRTRPLPGAQFFEFWRSDNVGAKNTLAANLHTLRRTVTLDISQQNDELRTNCDVHVQRLSLPERQVNSSTRIYGIFSQSSPSLQRLQLNPEQAKQVEWIDLGRDPQLEAEILKRIEIKLIQQAKHQLQTTENTT
jgi:hypothetical protein